MKFKELEIKEEGNWLKRKWSSPNFKKSLLYIVLGAIGGFVYFYFNEGKTLSEISTDHLIQHVITGAFLGYFITNSPCARGRC